MSVIIGLTGSYHTGKSTVAHFFQGFGARIIDLDSIAHLALEPTSSHFKKIVGMFGKEILVNGRIDRRRLAKKVFSHKKNRMRLNGLIHPFVIKTMKAMIASLSKKYAYIIVEAPLLFEARLQKHFDYIIIVAAHKTKQIERARKNHGYSIGDITQRIQSQLPLSEKKKKGDFVIMNNSTKTKTRDQVRAIMKQLEGLR